MSVLPIVRAARACTECKEILEPRPVLRLADTSRVLVIGQAPGSKVHASGVPWDDASGDHLREWLGVDRATFDDPRIFGILPMGFCYPGKGKSGDLPPPPICAERWHGKLTGALPHVTLSLLIGQYAQKAYLGKRRKKTLTETVEAFEEYGPNLLPLPHPSWRSRQWMKKHPWFEKKVLPALRARIAPLLDDVSAP